MKMTIIILILCLAGCASSVRQAGEPPPGTLWKQQSEYGYTDVYIAPDTLPQYVGGTEGFLSTVRAAMRGAPCADGEHHMFMTIVDEQGTVIGVHPYKRHGQAGACETTGAKAVRGIQFDPAIFNGEPVKAVIVIPIEYRK